MSFEEVRRRRLEALVASCIKKFRTKKPEGYKEWSWREKPYCGCDIFPGVLTQGNRNVCQFCAVTSAGQMELNAKFAKWSKSTCRLRFQWESLLTRFFELNGFIPESDHGEEERKMMELKYIVQDESIYDWDDASAWCFENLGVLADGDKAVVQYPLMSASNMYRRFSTTTDDKIKEIMENSRLVSKDNTDVNVGIDGYKYFEDLTLQEIWDYVENGRAVVAGVLAGKNFDYLKPDEIYAWIPKTKVENGVRKWFDKPVAHAIVLMGTGTLDL
ncbi:uncharacterized protein LOC119338071 [Triticum dicoccoides]|uniref:uncharacterized protein LOC119338071 n=1 Tax=Triticum dicoccoides TaxID=85692 RepID=UPI000E78CD70|nr:uncharacterized protein LOC119338071 [Triticum dicoccoides]